MSEFKKEARTLFASKAMELSDMFAVKFGTKAFEGSPRRMVKLQKPQESTGGGAQARESIVLLPAGQETGGLMAGWANVAEKQAEIRTFTALAALHQSRHGSALVLDQAQYEGFVQEAQAFFQAEGFAVRVKDDAPAQSGSMAQRPPTRPQAAKSGGGGAGMVLFALFALVAIGVGLGLGWFFFGRGA